MSYDSQKRILDIIVGLGVFFFFLPVFVLAPILIVLDSPGPVFADIPMRVGRKKKLFRLYKFRTMREGEEGMKAELKERNERKDGPFFKIKDDPRVTRVGRTLRKFWIDELPQLINVLRGEIALVGPRPYQPDEIAQYPEKYQFLKEEKAGITGLSQIKGSSNLPFREVLKYDAYYARHKSVGLDLWILLMTGLLLFKPNGV